MGRIMLFILIGFMGFSQTVTVGDNEYKLVGEILEDPRTYTYMFIEDGKDRGYEFDSVDGSFSLYEGTGSTVGYSVRSGACRGVFDIGLQRRHWYSSGFEERRFLVYHELGHGVLLLRHVCYGEPHHLRPDITAVYSDIMFSAVECSGQYTYGNELSWELSVDRLFDKDYQETYSCSTTTSKGILIDY